MSFPSSHCPSRQILLGNGALWLFLPPRHAVDVDASSQWDGEREVSPLTGVCPPRTLLSVQEEALSEQGLIKGRGTQRALGQDGVLVLKDRWPVAPWSSSCTPRTSTSFLLH